MYYPFLRGKRHELSALRKTASNLDSMKVRPIIEPVKESTNTLLRTVRELNANNINPLVIINPLVGDLVGNNSSDFFSDLIGEGLNFFPCIAFSQQNITSACQLANHLLGDGVDFATYFRDEPTVNVSNITSNALVNTVRATPNLSQIFQSQIPRLVKITDSFEAQSRNADYSTHPYVFSDAHVTYTNLPNAVGFGDYQIVGEPYTENGGPARAVAIHITYIEPACNDLMLIKHCVSTINSGTTSNTGGKFLEALGALITFANQTPALDQTTVGFQAFIDLYNRQHYPNLGPVKENSMMHHIETISNYL
ncbi:sce7725 family protein [Photobacterium rosenbergii]|uniref:Sce7725 family protein n=1 Tax=Photobacterium rosenbergii TaxID=294936 RepID=A0ABU3ZLZ7_9GAMM|nr:sce7725 family protein [Photobacterium rosenbergii]MDV5171042.1 sce7725 family protein [Photobacterium rosenbergii]